MSKRGAEWYKREPRAFLEGVRRLTEREVAVYAVVLDLIYDGGHETYDDPKHIASYFSDLGAAAVKKAVDKLVDAGKLIKNDGKLTNKRAKTQGKTREELAETRKKAGEKGGVSSGKSRRAVNENSNLTEANEPYAHAIDKIREEGEEREPKGSLSETSSDAPSKAGKNADYTEAFEAFWKAYPRDPNMSKAKAFAGWKKLTAEQRIACHAAVPAYRSFLEAKPDHPTMHAATFINERRFEGFIEQQAPATPKSVSDDDWTKRLNFGRQKSQWHVATWGPMPGADGCRVPDHLLQPSDGQLWTVWEA